MSIRETGGCIIKNVLKATLAIFCFLYLIGFWPESKNPKNVYNGLRFLYFTNISCFISILAYLMGILLRLKEKVYPYYNTVMQLALSCELTTFVIFWGLFFYKKELILGNSAKKYSIRPINNISSHVFPFLLLLIDQYGMQLIGNRFIDALILLVVIFYYILTRLYASKLGSYIYPFLNNLDELGRIMFFATNYIVLMASLRIFIYFKRASKPLEVQKCIC